jgi:hypothetical protein
MAHGSTRRIVPAAVAAAARAGLILLILTLLLGPQLHL